MSPRVRTRVDRELSSGLAPRTYHRIDAHGWVGKTTENFHGLPSTHLAASRRCLNLPIPRLTAEGRPSWPR